MLKTTRLGPDEKLSLRDYDHGCYQKTQNCWLGSRFSARRRCLHLSSYCEGMNDQRARHTRLGQNVPLSEGTHISDPWIWEYFPFVLQWGWRRRDPAGAWSRCVHLGRPDFHRSFRLLGIRRWRHVLCPIIRTASKSVLSLSVPPWWAPDLSSSSFSGPWSVQF